MPLHESLQRGFIAIFSIICSFYQTGQIQFFAGIKIHIELFSLYLVVIFSFQLFNGMIDDINRNS